MTFALGGGEGLKKAEKNQMRGWGSGTVYRARSQDAAQEMERN